MDKLRVIKNNKGITLIALIVTIVVLIILTGVAINLSLGKSGIINRAKIAKQNYQNAETKEKESIQKYENVINEEIVGNRGINTSNNKYSTSETVIGEWIDGKPIYRKTFYRTDFLSFNPNLDNPDMVKVTGIVYNTNNDWHYFPYIDGGYSLACYYHTNDNTVMFAKTSGVDATKIYVIVEYTKTTDKGNN